MFVMKQEEINHKEWFLFFDYALLAALSIVSVLGTWNPFVRYIRDNQNENNILAQSVIVVMVLYLFYRCIFVNKELFFINKTDIYLFVFNFIFACNSFAQSERFEKSDAMFQIKLFIDIILMILLRYLFVHNHHYINYSIICYIIFSIIIATLFIFGFLSPYTAIRSGRLYINGENPNSTSGRFVLASIFLIYMIIYNPYKWDLKRFFGVILFIPLIAIIVASGSRGSIIILACCIVALILTCNISIKIKASLIISLLIVLIFYYNYYFVNIVSDYSILSRFEQLINGNDAGRSMLIEEAKLLFNDSPWFGYGAKGFTEQMLQRFNERHTVHHLYYYLLATSGIIGSLPFFIFMIIYCYNSIRIRKYQNMSLVLMLFNLLLFSKTGGVLTYALSWYLFAIVSSYNEIYTSQLNVNMNSKSQEFSV